MINKHKSNKIKENSNTVRHLNNGTDHRHSKSCCDQSGPARRTMTTWSSQQTSHGSSVRAIHGVTPVSLNSGTLHVSPRLIGVYFADGILNIILLHKIGVFLFTFHWSFFLNGSIDINSALVQMMPWPRTGEWPLPQPMVAMFIDIYMHRSASMSLLFIRQISCASDCVVIAWLA